VSPPRRVEVDCPAKLNLFLEILGRRPDGYHELSTVMVPVDVRDTLEVRPARRFSLEVEGASLPGMNTVEKAFRAAARRARLPGARVRLVKRVPAGSGLGGGSSDAAAMLLALEELYRAGIDLDAAAAEVGSDVNFFLRPRAALCTGRGEKVHPLGFPLRAHAVIVWPGFPLSTAEVYRRAKDFLTPRPRSVMNFLNTAARGGPGGLGRALFNRLEAPARALRPELDHLLKRLGRLPFLAVRMTGSGSAVYGLCASREQARSMAREVARSGVRGWIAAAGTPPREAVWRSPRSASSS
jgi:4-diphosphocytidyl-2-C-methyl-D-erythritol kinase